MFRLTFLIPILLSPFVSFGQGLELEHANWNDFKLKEQVSELTEHTIQLSLVGEELNRLDTIQTTRYAFYRNGILARKSDITHDGSFSGYPVYVFDSLGYLTAYSHHTEANLEKYILEFDGAHLVARYSQHYGFLMGAGKNVYAYDEAGRLIRQRLYEDSATIIKEQLFTYYPKGQLKSIENSCCSTEEKGIVDGIFYFYDSKERLIREESQYSDSSKTYIHHYAYDENNQQILDSCSFTYYDHGEWLNGSYSDHYQFDKNGFVIDHFFNSPDQDFQNHWSYEYKLDKKGNWIERKRYLNSVPFSITCRSIQYFESN